MRIFLRDSISPDDFAEKLVWSCNRILEGSIKKGLAEDVRIGLYVAVRQVLSESLVRSKVCGTTDQCLQAKEEPPFKPEALQFVRH